jgi:hypothetical protein
LSLKPPKVSCNKQLVSSSLSAHFSHILLTEFCCSSTTQRAMCSCSMM